MLIMPDAGDCGKPVSGHLASGARPAVRADEEVQARRWFVGGRLCFLHREGRA